MVLSLFAWIGTSDVLMQAVIGILFPCIGWALLYFLKREITYRFPPKKPKQDEKLEEGKDKNRKELQ